MGGPAPVISSPLHLYPKSPKVLAGQPFPAKQGVWGGGGDDIVCSGKSRKEFLFWKCGRRIRRPNLSNSREGSSNPRFSRFFIVFNADKVFKRRQT